jgi:hypothetical protein
MRTAVASLMMALACLLASGCSSRPRAPVLSDDPVYQNNKEGFRFLAPTGWMQTARAEVPPGRREKETPIVAYSRDSGKFSASFRVSVIDLPETTDMAEFLAKRSYGVEHWTQTGAPEDVKVGSVTGVRYTFRGRLNRTEEQVKEVVCLRRGERVYLFTAMYTPGDREAQDQLRRVVENIIWKN